MMKKQGFTLAEVLVTLGIVGVIAALTAPGLIRSADNDVNASKLASAVSAIENGMQSAIVQEGVENLYETSLWQNGAIQSNSANIPAFVGNLGRYMPIAGYENNVNNLYRNTGVHAMNNSGGINNANVANFANEQFVIMLKNGSAILMSTSARPNNLEAQRTAAITAGCTLNTIAATAIIDVNGRGAPNSFGRDIFWFRLGENGVMYPEGGRDIARIYGHLNYWRESGNGKHTSCTDNSKGGNESARGRGCTARVVEEGYKITY